MDTERVKSTISLEAAIYVVTLSEIIVIGKDLRLANLLKARIKLSSVRLGTISKCTALDEAHVNKQI